MIARSLAALLAPSASGATVLANQVTTDAKKNKTKKKAKKKCQQQAGQCNAVFATVCDGDLECLAQAQVCCALLGACNATGFLTCATTPQAARRGTANSFFDLP